MKLTHRQTKLVKFFTEEYLNKVDDYIDAKDMFIADFNVYLDDEGDDAQILYITPDDTLQDIYSKSKINYQ